MANYNKITETKFKAVKTLLKGGASVREVIDYLKVSEPVVYAIRKVETYEEYVQVRAARELERKQVAAIKMKEKEKAQAAKAVAESVGAVPAATLAPQKVIHEQSVTIQATHYMMQELQKTNELLACISRKLAVIVEDLYGKEGTGEG